MWPNRMPVAKRLSAGLSNFSKHERHLPGVDSARTRETLAMQMVASLRRLDYTQLLQTRPISTSRIDPFSTMFDPERAAMLMARIGNVDEAFWLTFLAIHFGRHPTHGWQRVADIYSGFDSGIWNWSRISTDVGEFREWLRENESRIRGGFGNHRKYETVSASSPQSTAGVFETYVAWVGPGHSHRDRITDLLPPGSNDPHANFDRLYASMHVARFGRLAKFDFLALVGRLGLAPIAPGRAYLQGATGPLKGARRLFGGAPDADFGATDLERWLQHLDRELHVGMQVMEDSLCNWNKSPTRFIHFKG